METSNVCVNMALIMFLEDFSVYIYYQQVLSMSEYLNNEFNLPFWVENDLGETFSLAYLWLCHLILGNILYLHICSSWKCMCVPSYPVVSDSVTPWAVTHQAPLSMEFSRRECWSGLPFPSPGDLPWPRDPAHVSIVSYIGRQILYHCTTWETPLY